MQAMYHIPFLLWMVPYGGWRKCSTYDGTRAVVCMVLATWWCLQVAVILPTVKFGAGRHSNSNPPVFLIQQVIGGINGQGGIISDEFYINGYNNFTEIDSIVRFYEQKDNGNVKFIKANYYRKGSEKSYKNNKHSQQTQF